MPPVIWNGEPGDQYQNATGHVMWQLRCSLINTCGRCLQYHMAIAESWPLPFHRSCRCMSLPVAPGAKAEPWVDFRQVLREMPESQQIAAIGKAANSLLNAGKIQWSDIVTAARIRPLYEIVSRRGLSVSEMVAAGVSRSTAEAAAIISANRQTGESFHRNQLLPGLTMRHVIPFATAAAALAAVPENRRPVPPRDIIAGNAVIARIAAGNSPAQTPDFHGSMPALKEWLANHYDPTAIAGLTSHDWLILAAYLKAEEDLRAVLRKLGADVEGSMRVVNEAK